LDETLIVQRYFLSQRAHIKAIAIEASEPRNLGIYWPART
jgi:hypothetical protein